MLQTVGDESMASGPAEVPGEVPLPSNKELITVGKAIFARNWNLVPEELREEWRMDFTTRGFMRAQKVCGKKLVTLLESNPRKVIDAKNKVMIYIEGDGEKRVGQVKRKGETYWVHWFDK